MSLWPPSAAHLAGGLLILSVMLPLAGVLVVAVRGDVRGLAAGLRGVDGIGQAAVALRTVTSFAIPGLLLQLAGFGLLTSMLATAGDPVTHDLAFGLLVFGLAIAAIEGTFQASVTVWAGMQAELHGEVTEVFEPLRGWANLWLQRVYIPAVLTATAAYGWTITTTGVLPAWSGWTAIGWSLISLAHFLPARSNRTRCHPRRPPRDRHRPAHQ